MRLTVKQAWRVVALAFDLASIANKRSATRNAMGMCYFIRCMHDTKLITKRTKETMLGQIDACMGTGQMYLYTLDRRGDELRRDFAEDRA